MPRHLLRVIVLFVTLASGVALSRVWVACKHYINVSEPALSSLDSDGPAEYGSLLWRVRQARAAGEHHVRLDILSCGAVVSTLDEAVANYSIVIAQPVAKRTYVEKHDLLVWYKFKVLDVLSQKPLPSYSTWSSYVEVPVDLMPVKEDEVVIQGGNGAAWVEGVTVTQRTNMPEYSLSQRYLLFLEIDSARRVAALPWSSTAGVFAVNGAGAMKATAGGSYNLEEQMRRRFGNDVKKLRDYVGKMQGKSERKVF